MDDECWNDLMQDECLISHPVDPLRPCMQTTQYSEMFPRADLSSDGISPCPSSLSSPGESQHSGSSLHFATDDLISQPLADFDDGDCFLDDYEQRTGQTALEDLQMEYDSKPFYEPEYITDEASPSEKYFIVSDDSAYRPVAVRPALKTVYPVRGSVLTRPVTSSPSDDESKLPLPTLSRTRSKMHDLAVKNRLITDQNPKGQGVVQLSPEEKRTLLQEGYQLPTKLPLSREQEEALKLVRRKIKNKLSAQESRRKRKEYMDMLEQKVQMFYSENQSLRNRLKQVEAHNGELARRLRDLEVRMPELL